MMIDLIDEVTFIKRPWKPRIPSFKLPEDKVLDQWRWPIWVPDSLKNAVRKCPNYTCIDQYQVPVRASKLYIHSFHITFLRVWRSEVELDGPVALSLGAQDGYQSFIFLLFFRENASMRILVEQECRNSGLGLGTEVRRQEREECHGNTLWGSGLIVLWKKMLYAASDPAY